VVFRTSALNCWPCWRFDGTCKADSFTRLIVLQLVLDDAVNGFGRDTQPSGNVFFVAADEHAQHVFLEAVRVSHVLAFERGEVLLPMPARRATMETRLIHEEARLSPQVQVARHVDRVLVLVGCRFLVPARIALAYVGQRELHLDTMPVADAFVAEKLDAVGQVERYRNVHGLCHPWPPFPWVRFPYWIAAEASGRRVSWRIAALGWKKPEQSAENGPRGCISAFARVGNGPKRSIGESGDSLVKCGICRGLGKDSPEKEGETWMAWKRFSEKRMPREHQILHGS